MAGAGILSDFVSVQTSKTKGDAFKIHFKLIWPLPSKYLKKSQSHVGVLKATTSVKVKQMRHGFGTTPSSVVSVWGMCRELIVSGVMQELKQWVGVGGVGDGKGGNLAITLTVPISFCIVTSCSHSYNPTHKTNGKIGSFQASAYLLFS